MILQRRTVVVEGPLAYRMRRFEAASHGETGTDIVTIPQLAARLAGGFSRPADGEMLYAAIGSALDFDEYRELNGVRNLPGMARAAADTLISAWNADLDLQSLAGMSARMHDIALLERRVRQALPAGALIAPSLRTAALARKSFAKSLVGPITLDGIVDVEPVWRPLISALLSETTVEWYAPDGVDRSWFEGRLVIRPLAKPGSITGNICADPRSEAVEALRWARELLSRGDVKAADIAIVATSPASWDNHFLALVAHADVPLHFSHGIPALASTDGQACAALADVLLSGIDQVRIRRLLRRLPRRPFAAKLPTDWRSGLPARAGLFDLQQWRSALGKTRAADGGASETERALLPILELLSCGVDAAEDVGRLLLGGRSLMLWQEALRVAPPAAIGISLQRIRLPDGRDPANCVVWCPANHLAARPRAWARLLGLSGRSWPRSDRDDALVPDHILARRRLRPISSSERDRLTFDLILGQSANGIALSRSHRSAEGSLQSQSPLWPAGLTGTMQGRARIPEHAFSEADRLLARPQEAGRTPQIRATRLCWQNRNLETFTAHDGAVVASHPAVLRALARVQSTTSLRRLLRDPLGFVWRYALDWRSPEYARRPLALDARSFGELIHELLRLSVASLEPAPGFAGADPDQIGVALAAAVEVVAQRWPLERPVPPGLLWSHTLEQAANLTKRGLTADDKLQSGTRSWTELAFGQERVDVESADVPWDQSADVVVSSTGIRLKGRIDRVEVRGDGKAVRITDYKSGTPPRNADRVVVGRGSEVQRVLYAMAVQSLLPRAESVYSRLLYLGDESPPYSLRGEDLDRAATTLAQFVRAADGLLKAGSAAPGPDAVDRYNDMRLAHPADLDAYFRRKVAAFDAARRVPRTVCIVERAVKLPDEPNRRTALSDLASSLLVEAAAGTGKTSLMAGRVAMLLAEGAEPRGIAAITFTELAASELALRIRGYVHELLQGRIPSVFASALPKGLTEDQKLNLAQAAKRLDELTASTIHGFCQDVITSYAVEADLDPGARIVDAADADGIFDAAFSTWLIDRLSQSDDPSDPILVLSKSDPLKFVDMLKDLASLKRRHPTATVVPMRPGARADIEFADAVDDFARWAARTQRDAKTESVVEDLRQLADFFRDCFAAPPYFSRLWQLAHPPRVGAMKSKLNELAPYRRKTAWKELYGPEDGERISAEAEAHFGRAESAYRSLLGQVANGLVDPLSTALDEVVADYNARKRAAAALDFDDLLLRAHELVHRNEAVRRALGLRYRHIFVDEFQDTDPIQAAFIFQIAAEQRADRWQDVRVRPGALFLVGDPKQAIYRFRGADIRAYMEARKAMEAHSKVVQVTANFRSRKGLLDHVNDCFKSVLSAATQPGYVKLTHTIEDLDDAPPAVAKVTIDLPPDPTSEAQREAEAEAVADICARLIGSVEIVRADGSRSRLNPGDIALLTPTGTELWRYERALEQQGLSVASQAGQTLFLRQATQDVVALMRTLADPLDTLAFGAFMRGPLVGLTDTELLDITEELWTTAASENDTKHFSVLTEARRVTHPLARQALEALQLLRRRAGTTTPMLLLSEAAELLQIRVVLSARYGNRSARALANLDSLIEMARPYGVAGLRNFVHDLQRHWEAKTPKPEGRTDASDGAIEIVTMHSSKGLEWPVVIPINSATILRSPPEFVHRQSDNTLHWVLGGVTPTDLLKARQEEEHDQARERERVWYVACTRARDMLILPHLSEASTRSWSRAVDLGHGRLPEIRLDNLPESKPPTQAPDANKQTPEMFVAQAAQVARASPAIEWRRPSDHDMDRPENFEIAPSETVSSLDAPIPASGGRLRGILLHKLVEEILTGELVEDDVSVRERARALLGQLVGVQGLASGSVPDGDEAATTALRTLRLPDVASLRSGMIPEVSVWASQTSELLVAGRADAVVIDDGGSIISVLDWKSDVAPSPADRAHHAGQLSAYLAAIGAPRGAVVYMSLGETVWVHPTT